MRLLPGVAGLIEALDAEPDVALGLVTGNIIRGARLKLGSVGLAGCFAVGGYGSDDEIREHLPAIALERGDCPGARRHVLEARRIDGANLAIRVQQARIHRRCDEPRRALELLVTLGDRERSEAAVTGEISAGFRDLGEPVKAAEAWEHRLLLHPVAWRAALGAAEARPEAGALERARVDLRKARLAAPRPAEVRAVRGAIPPGPPNGPNRIKPKEGSQSAIGS